MTDLPRKRGRPRKFDPAVALARAEHTFLRFGYAGSSLEVLAREMDLNKPSLYGAFGDKRALFVSVLEERQRRVGHRYQTAFRAGKTLEESLRRLFEEAVEVTLGDGGPPGCPIASAAATDALADAGIGSLLHQLRVQADRGIARWLRERIDGEGIVAVEGIARLVNAVLYDLALRAHVGESRAKLREIARDAARALSLAARPA